MSVYRCLHERLMHNHAEIAKGPGRQRVDLQTAPAKMKSTELELDEGCDLFRFLRGRPVYDLIWNSPAFPRRLSSSAQTCRR